MPCTTATVSPALDAAIQKFINKVTVVRGARDVVHRVREHPQGGDGG